MQEVDCEKCRIVSFLITISIVVVLSACCIFCQAGKPCTHRAVERALQRRYVIHLYKQNGHPGV